ncbi:MAG: bifunctional 2-polyprenyl-6-hydroxyphenol methylase/3-demethylubiquinol 3-O-methyltransferase UbiG [Bacteroidota bacterium]
MPVNNRIYTTESGGWWDENHFLHLLKTGINPARFAYFRDALAGELSIEPAGLSVLDVGCGGGILSEEFAALSCRVTGIDLSAASLSVARDHAARSGLRVDYCQAGAERVPFDAAAFDVVLCCDVLEHVDDPGQVIREAARLLKTGGILFYDTINRTDASRAENIIVAQQFPLTRFFPPDTHVWEKFITPQELLVFFERAGLENRAMTGLRSGLSNLSAAGLLIRRKLGLLTFAELGRRLHFITGGDLHASYLGWAVKR